MSLARFAAVSLALVALAAPALADDSGNFVVRLGQDTTSVEHYNRTAARIEVNQVGRAPRVLKRHFVYDFTNGTISKLALTVTPPTSTTPTQTIDASFGTDSIRVQIHNGAAPVQTITVATQPGVMPVALSSPWAMYERAISKLVQGKGDSLRVPIYLLGADVMNWLSLHKLGRDSVLLANDHLDVFHVRVDKTGHVLGVLPISGTGKFSVERVANLDLDAMTAGFAAREQAGAGVGALSPRDSVRANVGGAALSVDYSRPGKRGRVIYGNVVPYGEVWRTGANAATLFRTDKALDFGGTVVPAGFYTLWTLPTASGWKLIINSQTGQWGTAHDATKDLYTIDMKVSALPQPVERFTISVDPGSDGGVLNLDWDTTRASAAFAVKP
jgi:hypothetical protein